MSGDEDTLDLELRSLTLQLQQVQLEQERLERKLKRVQAQLRKRDQQRGQEAAPAVSGEQQAYLGKRANTDTHVKIQEEWVGLCRAVYRSTASRRQGPHFEPQGRSSKHRNNYRVLFWRKT